MKVLYLASGVLAIIYTEAEYERLQQAARNRCCDILSLIDVAVATYMTEIETGCGRHPDDPTGDQTHDKRG